MAPFYYHPRMLAYNFGPQHPLKPERLRRTIELIERLGGECLDPGLGDPADVLRVHQASYVDFVRNLCPPTWDAVEAATYGLGITDNPIFENMHGASLAYVAGSVEAAKRVCEGAPLAFGIAGGLHHARKAMAHGFCVFNDCAITAHVLRERFERVAYVDIDVHHGCGVQWLFYDDPTVLTCSIHQDGRTLYPGSGSPDETGAQFTAINVAVAPETTGDVWLDAFRRGIMPALERFDPGAIVLQLGCDSHAKDPLARVQNSVQHWLASIRHVRDFGRPIVALGGGGYELTNVPRMWAAAWQTLLGQEVPDFVPADLADRWSMPTFLDPEPLPEGIGREASERVIQFLVESVHPRVGTG